MAQKTHSLLIFLLGRSLVHYLSKRKCSAEQLNKQNNQLRKRGFFLLHRVQSNG